MPYGPTGGSTNPVDKGIKKYYSKMDYLRLSRKMKPIIDQAHKKAGVSFANNNYVIGQILPIVHQFGIVRELYIMYCAYGNLLYKSQRNLTFMVDLIREHQILRGKFETRGLDPNILDLIDERLIIHKVIIPPVILVKDMLELSNGHDILSGIKKYFGLGVSGSTPVKVGVPIPFKSTLKNLYVYEDTTPYIPSNPLTLDQSAKTDQSSASTFNINITTSEDNALCVLDLQINGTSITITSVTSSPSLTWTKRGEQQEGYGHFREFRYYAFLHSHGSLTVTVNLSGSVQCGGVLYDILNASESVTFDGSCITSTTADTDITTVGSNEMLIGFIGAGSGEPPEPSGWDTIQGTNGYCGFRAVKRDATDPTTYTLNNGGYNGFCNILDAINPASVGGGGGVSDTFKVIINGSESTLEALITSPALEGSDTTHTENVEAGDLVCVELDFGGSISSTTYTAFLEADAR